jgi:hypothetical protein
LSWGHNHDTDERSGLRNGHQIHLLANRYVTVDRGGFDRERAILPEAVLAFIRATQPREWVNQDTRRTAADHVILLLKEDPTALITAVVTSRNTIHESTEDTLPGQ